MKEFLTLWRSSSWLLLGIVFFSLINVGATLYVPTVTASLLNEGVLKGDLVFIYSKIGWMLGASLLTVVTAVMNTFLSASAAAKIGQEVRKRLNYAVESYTMNDFNHFGRGSLTIRMTHDVEKLQSLLGEFFTMVLPTPIMIVVGLGLTFSIDHRLGYIVVGVMVLVLISTILIQYLSLPYVRQIQIQLDKIADLFREHIEGMKVIRAFNRGDYEQGRENQAFEEVAKRSVSMAKLYSFMLPVILIIFNISSVVLIWAGGYRVEGGYIQIGDIIAVVEYALQILLALTMSVFVFMDLPEVLVGLTRIREVLNFPVTDINALSTQREASIHAIASENESDSVSTTSGSPLLELQDVTFRYDDAEIPALESVSLCINRGQTIAIMGDIGSGKSSLVHVLMGLAPIESGRINLLGKSIYDQSLESLRKHMAYVPQKAFLFTGTIRDNLVHGLRALGDFSEAEIEERMNRACQICDAYDFIQQFPLGYEHILVQGGTNVSGGQRQRLAMARALMRQVDLYIFDDSFSALDGTTERRVRAALQAWIAKQENSALISIEQKVSSAKSADAIAVLEEGHLVGFGSHEELLATCSVYRQIAESQEVKV